MKVLVIGSNGMAGHMISLYFNDQGHEVVGLARNKSKLIKTIVGDAENLELVKNTIVHGRYDSVINCIGILNQFAEENHEKAVFINSYFPHFLAQVTKETDTQIIHISTDCVFSGERGLYTEADFKDGDTFYDRTKALGEIDNGKDITLRQSIVGPDLKQNGIGLLNWFMQQEGEVYGFTKAIWTGQTTLQLAKTMEQAVMSRAHGLYNMVPENTITKYDLLKLFNKYLRNNELTIKKVDGIKADKSLRRTNFDFDYSVPSYECMINEMAIWMGNHKKLYPHYYNETC